MNPVTGPLDMDAYWAHRAAFDLGVAYVPVTHIFGGEAPHD